MPKPITTQESQSPFLGIDTFFFKSIASPFGLSFIAVIALLIFVSYWEKRSGKPVLADGRWANRIEMAACKRQGRKQAKAGVFNDAALYLGSDQKFWIPNANGHISIYGKSGIGKTETFVSPIIDSGIEQGMSMLVLDVKGDLMRRHAAYALANDYELGILAPGQPYSDSINLLDFMRDYLDDGMANQIGVNLNRNFAVPGSTPDPFFGPQGDATLKLLFMLAKFGPHKDFLAVWKLLSLSEPNIAARLVAAKKYEKINSWLADAAEAIKTASIAEETIAGILTSAITHFQTLISYSFLPCLMQTTIPLDMQGRQIIFFQPDLQRMSSTTPIIATAIHMLIARNVNPEIKRTVPLMLVADECDSVYLSALKTYTTLMRGLGLIVVLSFQSDNQPRFTYGRDYAAAALSSCTTQITMNPGDTNTASAVSTSLGQQQVNFKRKSQSFGSTSSTSMGDDIQQVPLCSTAHINSMGKGSAIIQSLSYTADPTDNSRPWKGKVPFNKSDKKRRDECEAVWDSSLKESLINQAAKVQEALNLPLAGSDREMMANAILPPPAELKALEKLNNPKKKEDKSKKNNLINAYLAT
jgi:type IV secretion system protein VirD4